MTDNKEFATCSCCGKTVKKGDMYFEAGFFDRYEIVDGEYVYKDTQFVKIAIITASKNKIYGEKFV